jgi:hypothetical protein
MKRELTPVLMVVISAVISLISIDLAYRDNNVNVLVIPAMSFVAVLLAIVGAIIRLRR